MNFLIRNFLRGLVIVVPGAVTVYILYVGFVSIDRLLRLRIPGLGFLITIAAVILIGILGSNLVGRTLFQLTDRVFTRAPFVKIVYSSIKDLIEAFVGENKRFNRPVLVAFPQIGSARAVGFVTRDDLADLGLPGFVAVYFPQSYNFAGNLLLVEKAQITPIEIDSAKVMPFVVSGGVSGLQ